jgi:pilus assembly protein Flp/PilA
VRIIALRRLLPGGVQRAVVSAACSSEKFYLEISMNTLALKVCKFLKSEDGPTAVEYAVMLALIVVVCLTAIQSIGTRANSTFNNVAQQLGGAAAAS